MCRYTVYIRIDSKQTWVNTVYLSLGYWIISYPFAFAFGCRGTLGR